MAYRLFLVGCQVEERVILNCGFEDGAIVFLGMLFILIIYFVVPRACLMHGLWNADFVDAYRPLHLSFLYNAIFLGVLERCGFCISCQ